MTVDERRARLLEWEGCLNARDLGGYPTIDGQETSWGAVLRSDNLTPLTDAGRQAVVNSGVRSIVDLRTPEELELHPNPFAAPGEHDIAYTHLSLVDPAAAPGPEFTTLANDYKGLLDRFASQIGQIMTTIARAPRGGVLIHCMAGKDRTGIISALLLDLAGVPRETIGADYALSAENLRPADEEWLETGPGERAEREQRLQTFLPRAEVMIEVLDYLDQRYGGVEPYLRQAGVSAEDIEHLRHRMRES